MGFLDLISKAIRMNTKITESRPVILRIRKWRYRFS